MDRAVGDVVLREVRESDLPIFFEQFRDPEAVRMAAFTAKDPSDRGAFDAHWRKLLALPHVLARTAVAGGEIVGSILTFEQEGTREVTYWIDRRRWGRGHASHALAAMLRLDRVRPLYARAAKDNLGSIRVLEKAGFRLVRHERGFANSRGAEIDEVVLVLDAESSR